MPVPGVEVTDETGKLPPYVSTVLSFAVARFGIMVKTVAATQPGSALLCFAPHLVGNGFIRSACYGFVGTLRSD